MVLILVHLCIALLVSPLIAVVSRRGVSVPNFSLRPPPLRDTALIHYKATYACEGNHLHLSCEEDRHIHLVRANYGRFSISICNDGGRLDLSSNCMSYRSFLFMQDRCNQKTNCSVVVSSKLFGDPCPGTLKYLEVQYHCAHSKSSSSTTKRPPTLLVTNNSNNNKNRATGQPSLPSSSSSSGSGHHQLWTLNYSTVLISSSSSTTRRPPSVQIIIPTVQPSSGGPQGNSHHQWTNYSSVLTSSSSSPSSASEPVLNGGRGLPPSIEGVITDNKGPGDVKEGHESSIDDDDTSEDINVNQAVNSGFKPLTPNGTIDSSGREPPPLSTGDASSVDADIGLSSDSSSSSSSYEFPPIAFILFGFFNTLFILLVIFYCTVLRHHHRYAHCVPFLSWFVKQKQSECETTKVGSVDDSGSSGDIGHGTTIVHHQSPVYGTNTNPMVTQVATKVSGILQPTSQQHFNQHHAGHMMSGYKYVNPSVMSGERGRLLHATVAGVRRPLPLAPTEPIYNSVESNGTTPIPNYHQLKFHNVFLQYT